MMSGFEAALSEDLAATSLGDGARVDALEEAVEHSPEAVDASPVAGGAEPTPLQRAVVEDQVFLRGNLPRAAIVSLNKEFSTVVIM